MTSTAAGGGAVHAGGVNFTRSLPGTAAVRVTLTDNDPTEVRHRKSVANPPLTPAKIPAATYRLPQWLGHRPVAPAQAGVHRMRPDLACAGMTGGGLE